MTVVRPYHNRIGLDARSLGQGCGHTSAETVNGRPVALELKGMDEKMPIFGNAVAPRLTRASLAGPHDTKVGPGVLAMRPSADTLYWKFDQPSCRALIVPHDPTLYVRCRTVLVAPTLTGTSMKRPEQFCGVVALRLARSGAAARRQPEQSLDAEHVARYYEGASSSSRAACSRSRRAFSFMDAFDFVPRQSSAVSPHPRCRCAVLLQPRDSR